MVDFFTILRRRRVAFCALSAGAFLLCGCQRVSTLGFDTQSAFGSVSLTERCIDLLHRAYPNAEFDVKDRGVKVEGNAATITIAAARKGVPANGPYARGVAVECRFESGILTSFRWTAGPIRPTGVGEAP